MSVKLSAGVRNARLDSIETTIGTSPILRWYSGSVPANTAASPGTVIASGTLPSDYLAAASSGAKAKSGTWTVTGNSSAAGGTDATYFRIYDSGDTTCHVQGTVSDTGGGGDMTADNANIADTQVATISTFTLTDGNA